MATQQASARVVAPHARREFLDDIHCLRGVAIVMVVATHCVSAFSWDEHPCALQFCLDLFDDSSLLFVFIAGLLFQRAAAGPSFNYGRFVRRKAVVVFVPFALLSLPGALYTLRQASVMQGLGLSDRAALFKLGYLYLYPGGQVNYALWFIPVVLLLYLAAPLLRLPIRHPWLYAVLAVLLPVSLLMQRPTHAHDHNLLLALYFLPAYLIGMACGQYLHRVEPALDHFMVPLLTVALTVFIAHFLLAPHHGKYVMGTGSGAVDWLFVQKLLLCLGVWALLRRARGAWPVLKPLAQASFTIYFLHMYVLFTVEAVVFRFHRPAVSLGALLMLLALSVGVPMVAAAGARVATPRWSRMLVGA